MFDKRLKQLRIEKGLLQKNVAEVINITTSAYGFYEQGKRMPDADTLGKLADFFDVSTDFLLGRTKIRYTVDKYLSFSSTEKPQSSFYSFDELPTKAREELEDYMSYLKHKYNK